MFGREDELAKLDQLAKNPSKKVLTIVAFGGVGKTSLVIEWMARQAAKNWEGWDCVFDWSFFSQGTREKGDTASAEAFVAAALRFFGDATMVESAASPWDKGSRLAQLVAERRTLLVLDGVEPLQHPPGPLAGELKDPALATLLKGLARNNSGLCIVTTREQVADLAPFRDTTAPEWQLHHLSTPAGIELLKALGVRGTAAEFQQAVKKVKGHALTLNLLGHYLAKAHAGDIRKSDQVKFERADAATQGGYAFKAIGAYERWLHQGGEAGARQLAVLRLLGLFDRPADAGCIEALRAEPVIANLTEAVVGLDDEDWNLAISALEECSLVSRVSELQTPDAKLGTTFDAHPLIRHYFAKQLREKAPAAWKGAHGRLYEYLRDNTNEGDEPTLEDLQPLYQAVAHGCQAGRQQEVCDEIYFARIQRGGEAYSTKKLGAHGFDLAAVTSFFDTPWKKVSPTLKESDQAWVLNEAAYTLRATGRLGEALSTFQTGLAMRVKAEDWPNAATASINLSELRLTLGEIEEAMRHAKQSVSYSDVSGNVYLPVRSRGVLADILHQAGRHAEALAEFRQAEKTQAVTGFPELVSWPGFWHRELLLSEVERAAWQVMCDSTLPSSNALASLAVKIEPVYKYAKRNLEHAESWADLSSIGLANLSLGNAALYNTLLAISSLDSCQAYVHRAVDSLRRSGESHFLSRALVTRSWLYRLENKHDGSRDDLNEAWEIAERGPMRLHMADIHLYRARLFHAVKPYPWNKFADGSEGRGAKNDLADARKLIEQCGYWRRKEELEDAEEAAKSWS